MQGSANPCFGRTMTSKYLRCDSCDATLGAQEVMKLRVPGPFDTRELVEEAKRRGWTGPMRQYLTGLERNEYEGDKCPACSK